MYYFCQCPVRLQHRQRKEKFDILTDYFSQLVHLKQVTLPSADKINYALLEKQYYGEDDLEQLENIHNMLEVYLWLANKYEEEFIEKDIAIILVQKACQWIDSILKEGLGAGFLRGIQ